MFRFVAAVQIRQVVLEYQSVEVFILDVISRTILFVERICLLASHLGKLRCEPRSGNASKMCQTGRKPTENNSSLCKYFISLSADGAVVKNLKKWWKQ